MMAALATLLGCRDYEADRLVEPVSVDVGFIISTPAKEDATARTRMTDATVQAGGSFRDLQEVRMVPFILGNFTSDRRVTLIDEPKRNVINSEYADAAMSNSPYYFYKNCLFMQGVNAFLVYARAREQAADDQQAGYMLNGSLIPTFPAAMGPDGISFRPRQICQSIEAPAGAVEVADYLTAIANTTANGIAWRDFNNSFLQALYNNFINKSTGEDPKEMAGSAANANAHVANLKKSLDEAALPVGTGAGDMAQAILDNIAGGLDSDYPRSIGLPDGAAVVRWSTAGQYFIPETQPTTMAPDMNAITRYAYPADLWYYGNTHICTSSEADTTPHDPDTTPWSAVLSGFYPYKDGVVLLDTKAIALTDPLQYGVARLVVKLRTTSATLPDAAGKDIIVEPTGYTKVFPLTGIIVGGQRSVGFDFTPDATSAETWLVYDSQTNNDDGTPKLCLTPTTGPGYDVCDGEVSTLLLQNADNEPVNVILEFLNNGPTAFRGMNGGVVRPGTKFYLVGEISGPSSTAGDYRSRVFTQDYTTTATFNIVSLAKAYNVLPDLLSSTLQVGVQLTTDWTQSTTTYTVLK